MTLDPLNEATDRLNLALTDAEEALADLGLNMAVSIALEGDHVLWFKKHGGVWRLVVAHRDDETAAHLLTKSRKTRLEVASRLSELHDALHEAYEDELRRVGKAIVSVTAFAARVRATHPPRE